MKLYDLVVVSSFGRGNWLAQEFASRGWSVSLLDVDLGSYDERDIEGPFGLLEASDLLPSQRARLVDEGEFANVPQGFSIWLPEGPLEFRSELTPYLLRSREIPFEVENYLRQPSHTSKEALGELRNIKKLQYSHSWLAQFAHSFAAAAQHENYIALSSESVAPLFAPFGLRQSTSTGVAKGLQNCRTNGVSVETRVALKDLKLDGKTAVSVEYEGGVVNGRAFVWCLSHHETKKISDSLLRHLWPSDWPEASWTWQRLSFDVDDKEFLSMLPLSTIVIEDVDLAWTRANMIVVRRREGEAKLDAWVKCPAWMVSREQDAFAQVEVEVRANLARRFPGVTLQKSTGTPSRDILWPIWPKDEFAKLDSRTLSNLFFDAPGAWWSLDWMGRFRHENTIVERLEKLKTQWDAAARKAARQAEVAAQRRAQK